MLFQQLKIDTGLIIITLGIGSRMQGTKVSKTLIILRQQDQMVIVPLMSSTRNIPQFFYIIRNTFVKRMPIRSCISFLPTPLRDYKELRIQVALSSS